MKALQSKKGSVTGAKLHPNSRRAKQLQRIELRSRKLDVQSKVRRSNEIGRSEPTFFPRRRGSGEGYS